MNNLTSVKTFLCLLITLSLTIAAVFYMQRNFMEPQTVASGRYTTTQAVLSSVYGEGDINSLNKAIFTNAVPVLTTSSKNSNAVETMPCSSDNIITHTYIPQQCIVHLKQLLQVQRHLVRGHRYIKSGKAAIEIRQGIALLHNVIQSSFATMNSEMGNLSVFGTENSSVTQLQPFVYDEAPSEENSSETLSEELVKETSVVQQNIVTSLANSSRHVTRSLEVCPEVWGGSRAGYPYYFEGFNMVNCSGVPKFGSLITIALNVVHSTAISALPNILMGIWKQYPTVPIVAGCSKSMLKNVQKFLPNNGSNSSWRFIAVSHDATAEGGAWKLILDAVKTKYVLIGRDLANFVAFERLERMVRVLNETGADIVGGGHRNASGHWSPGCFQTSMRNYAFQVAKGYDMSFNSCMVCDYLGAPFASRTNFIKQYFEDGFWGETLFLNMFAEVRRQNSEALSLSCPDAMFFTETLSFSTIDRNQLLPFVQKWELNLLRLQNTEYFFNCNEAAISCVAQWAVKGVAMPLCCLRLLESMVKFLMKSCEKFNMTCEVEAGTNVGVVKFGGLLPWERDADINWMASGFETMEKLIPFFQQNGYSLAFEETRGQPPIQQCMTDKSNVNCGYYSMRDKSATWRIEIWGVSYTSQHFLDERNITLRTKVPFEGAWINGYPNPAIFARNLYGDDVFAHVEHWLSLGHQDGWLPYKTGKFETCSRPGFHGCLDQFLPYGNLQFLDVWL